jgi:para-nitrobenzyl esterase
MPKVDKRRYLLAFLAVVASDGRPQSAYVATSSGPVQGVINGQIVAYLGIPYAEPPVGELRWRPPVAARPWQTVLPATKFGKRCMQFVRGENHDAESEDCLFLNVYVPRNTRRDPPGIFKQPLLPVMVWIHGGANAGASADLFDPTPLVETAGGVVVVTLNYRLGTLGFLAHPALDTEGQPAVNYGILDQQLALKWVRANIAHFGGNAHNITIFGESAGGLNVTTHLVSPLSAGLFERAIIQSGAYQLDTPSLAASEGLGTRFAKRVGCESRTVACLRALPIAKVMADIDSNGPTAFNQSTVDGQVLIETQRSALASGRFKRVPIMQGANSDEGRTGAQLARGDDELRTMLESAATARSKDLGQALEIYSAARYGSLRNAVGAALGDHGFACGAQESNRLLSRWVPSYAYEFADADSGAFGATHAAELKYLFDVSAFRTIKPTVVPVEVILALAGNPASLAPQSRTLSKAMRLSWVNFARTGDPRSDEIPEWQQASEGIQLLIPPRPRIKSLADFSAEHHCEFWR